MSATDSHIIRVQIILKDKQMRVLEMMQMAMIKHKRKKQK